MFPKFSSFVLAVMQSVSGAAVACMTPTSIQEQIDALAAKGGGTVVVPKGEWVTRPIVLKSNITLKLEDGAVLLGSTNLADYARADTPGVSRALVSAEDAENIAIVGKGRFDGRGDCFHEKYASAASQPRKTPMMMKFVRCRNVRLEDFSYGRSGSWGIHLMSSDGVEVRRLKCYNHYNRCNDGIDIESRNVLIEDCEIDADDDALCFKSESDRGFVIENVTVRRCRLATTCNFIKFGTGSYGTWRNILIEDCVLDRATAAFLYHWPHPGVRDRITGLAGIALSVVDGGRMENVTIRNITMNAGVGTPLFVRLGRRHPNADGLGTHFKNVLVENVKMTQPAASRIASSITGVPGLPVSGVTLRNCDFLFPGGGTRKEAADRKIPEAESRYPECSMFNRKALPAYGLYLRHVDGLTLDNVKLRLASPDCRPAIYREDVRNVRSSETAPDGDDFSWPEPTQTMKPWAINWWLGGAADEAGLENQCAEMERARFGGFNVVHVYQYRKAAKDGKPFVPDEACRKFMSDDWLETWNRCVRIARRHGLGVDLSMCSGWNFGGPWVTKADAPSSLSKVKVAGPGGAGYEIDPFSPTAMRHHIDRFEQAFGKNGTAERPRAFYHDSFEYVGARPKHGEDLDEAMIATFKVWTDWCRDNGYLTRYQAHGSPANWLDLYALSTVPETEMFGRRDADRDILISKFASSAAHVKGLKLVSAEACTWVDEHFHEKPGDVKLMLDQLFLSGVNHVFYHGYCYSPVDAPWPGWCFYASLQMNPRNPLWREVGVLNDYVIRCQSIFQTWQPDNDLLVKWDPEDYRSRKDRRGRQNRGKLMSIHTSKEWFNPFETGRRARELWSNGYQFDFVSARQLKADPSLAARLDVAKARPSPFNQAKTGLVSTRWRDERGRILYFVANHGTRTRAITGRFTAMDPMTGEIAAHRRCEIEPLQTLFVSGEDLGVETAVAPRVAAAAKLTCGDWRVTAVAGGPVLPASTNLAQLVSWTAWDEAFAGTMRYETTLCADGDVALPAELDLGRVCEVARVRLNGQDLGCRLFAPYRFVLPPGLLRRGANELSVEVTGLGANRIRWIYRTNQPWKKFGDTNFVNYDYRSFDASKWNVVPCGLLGPISLVTPAQVPPPCRDEARQAAHRASREAILSCPPAH